jgi:hypothetical protein
MSTEIIGIIFKYNHKTIETHCSKLISLDYLPRALTARIKRTAAVTMRTRFIV